MCKRPEGASPAATPVQLSLPHSAATSAPGGAASAATLVQHSMPSSAAARASELPRHALDQAKQENQLPDDTRTSETQIEASRSPEILPCVSELKKLKSCNFSSKRQCSLPDVCTERCVVLLVNLVSFSQTRV